MDRTTQTWTDTGVRIDDRPATRAVASNVRAESAEASASGLEARLYRYSYGGGRYTLDPGFPVRINDVSTESLTLDKDSRGVLWATWTKGDTLYVNATDGVDTHWGTSFVPDVPGAHGLDEDDLSTVAAFGRTGVALMWSGQTSSTFYLAVHADGDPPDRWTPRIAWSRKGLADDHLSLKGVEGDGAGVLYAAVKTSLDHRGSPDAPQILPLRLDLFQGTWTSAVLGTVGECHTRPILAIDRVGRVAHVFATAPTTEVCRHAGTPGVIYEKTTSLDHLAFAPGRGTPVLRDHASADLNGRRAEGCHDRTTPAV